MLLMMMKVTFDNTTITWGQYVTNNGMTACHFHILRLFDVLPKSFFSPQVKRYANITYKHGIYELPNDLRLSI